MSAAIYDALIIGGGHNGLVCGFYLAAAGLKTLILERRDQVGGAAVTEEFHPGFRNSLASYTVSLLNQKIIRDLELARHGLRIVRAPARQFPAARRWPLSQALGRAGRKPKSRNFPPAMPNGSMPMAQGSKHMADVLRALVLETPPNCAGRGSAASLRELLRQRAARQPAAQARSRRRPRPSRDLHRARPAIFSTIGSKAHRSRRLRLRRHRRQLCEPLCAGLRLCAAASLLRRGERQEGRLGPCDRRHGRDHPGDGAGRARRRRRDSRPRSGVAKCSSRRAAPSASSPRQRRDASRSGDHRPTSTRSCSIETLIDPARAARRLSRSHRAHGAAAPARFG